MNTTVRRRGALVGALALVSAFFVPLTAQAAEGSPPPSAELRVLSRVHTDAVSTFPTGSGFELASKADVAEGNGTRLDPATVLFHLDADAAQQVRAGYEFIAPVGSQIWMAPESNPMGPEGYAALWPGFSTESVPAGALQGDRTTFTLEDLQGPGDLELFTGGGLSSPNRLWSSDEDITSFTIGRTHMHANWAFTASGTYTLDVSAQASTAAGAAVSARNTYTFVVGDLAPAAATTTTLTASTTAAAAGQALTLSATVSPAAATGWVEFRDGDTVLGHQEVAAGTAEITTSALALGQRSVTARFVPALLNDYTPSTSAIVTIAVSQDPGGDVFGITGLKGTYQAGEIIDLTATGVPALRDGERLRWAVRSPATGGSTYFSAGPSDDRWTRDATTALNGVEISLVIYNSSLPSAQRYVQRTPWQPFHVTGQDIGSGDLAVTWQGLEESYFGGDPIRVTAQHDDLSTDQSYRWVFRGLPYDTSWNELTEFQGAPTGENPFLIDTQTVVWSEIALEVVDAQGAVVGRSPAIHPSVTQRELVLEGARGVYRAGETIEIASTLTPARDDAAYRWLLGPNQWEATEVGIGPDLTLPITAEMERQTLFLIATDATTGSQIASPSHVVRVTESAPGAQVLLLAGLGEHGDHYHQGSPVVLQAVADPVASDSDVYRWEWKRPDQQGWSVIEGFTGPRHEVTAEQALDDTQVRATLLTSTGIELATSEIGTILVDDHGAAPRQRVTITGTADGYTAGQSITVTAGVAPSSVLQRWEWHVQRPGASQSELLTTETASSVTLTAAEDLDGAQLTARLTFDDGRVYVQSTPVTLTVAPAPVEPITFTDVPEDLQFAEEITWLAARGISTGWEMPDGTHQYRPVTPIARDAMAAFLYRMAGSPAYQEPQDSPFTDVATNNQFYKEIAWTHASGISTGWPNGDGTSSYRPLENINRDAMAAFLYRYAKPASYHAPPTSAFTDVATDNQFYKEIAWLHASGISTGWVQPDDTTQYRPLTNINRDAMAAFLHRYHHRSG
ncbi:hypothetical protein C8046_03495 [Serinibacter arcticus]|uniref:SLH domain-containing protein n=1 Tax=Serinibacter arcticus TaxID=1655435 RepID=A0A2U1ZSC1_9MICO|nr:choice-of-anchor M domain-containing protein [Serinibacter arcticus]PWD49885.1 hypothetical protein C8046_03495 [Serinibacter arcticus]